LLTLNQLELELVKYGKRRDVGIQGFGN
jgi:hypothetical protein